MTMLEIKNLHVSVDGKPILRGVDLRVAAGEVHAIMGPNGSGKSTLAHVLAGREHFRVTAGEVTYEGRNLLDMAPEERAREGVFLAFQYPVEIPGVSNIYLLKAALNAIRKHRGEPELDAIEFLARIKDKLKQMDMDQALLNRAVNEGFSGGAKKRNEILQMAVLEPKLAILDEPDSGLDIAHRRGSIVLLHAARTLVRRRRFDDRQRILQGGFQGAADGIRGRGAEAARRKSGREHRLK